jgi:6-phosphogluconolactonase
MKKRVRAFLVCIAGLATIGLANCGKYNCATDDGLSFSGGTCNSSSPSGSSTGTGGSGTASAFVFAGDPGGTIDSYTLSTSSGTLAATSGYTGPSAPANTSPDSMVVAQGLYLYALYGGTGQLFGWSISSDGGLTAISGSPVSVPYLIGGTLGGVQNMITNPTGTLLFVENQSADEVYVYQIGSGGALAPANNGSPYVVPFLPLNLATDGLGKYLYVTADSEDTSVPAEIAAYAISSSGSLTVVPGSPFTSYMLQVEGDPSGKYLIGTTGAVTGDTHLYVFGIQQTGTNAGAIAQVSGSPFTTVYSPYSIAVQSNAGGDLVYSFSLEGTGSGYNPIEGYQLNTSTGALTAVSGSPFTSLGIGYLGQFDQSGAFLSVYGSGPVLGILDVGSGGALTQPISSVDLTEAGPWVITDPN